MRVITENSIYEFKEDEKLVRRVPRMIWATELRADDEWKKYFTVHYKVGEPMRIVMEHLGGEENNLTLRTTSHVLEVQD